MLFKLAVKNIKNSLRDYAIYFYTLVIGVAIFYSFNSITSQKSLQELTGSRGQTANFLLSDSGGEGQPVLQPKDSQLFKQRRAYGGAEESARSRYDREWVRIPCDR